MKKIVQNIVVSLIIACSLVSISAQAANLIAVVIADTMDESVGGLVKIDFDDFLDQVQKIADYTGLNPEVISLSGYDVTPWKVWDVIKSLEVQKDDVVIFFFSGHGFRTKDKDPNPWPDMYFTLFGKGVDYQEVIDVLEEKQPRLLISMLNSCNSYLPEGALINIVHRAKSPVMIKADTSGRIRNNYKRLFLDKLGNINITSSKVGEYSWGNDVVGGFYPHEFLNGLEKEVARRRSSWEHLLSVVDDNVKDWQDPYYEMDLHN